MDAFYPRTIRSKGKGVFIIWERTKGSSSTLPNAALSITAFADGEIVPFDVSSMCEKHPGFKRLEDRNMFESVKVDGVGYGVCWDGELDLSSDGIYFRGEHIAKTDADPRLLLGLIVSNAREEMSLSQRELSKRSGVMQAEISRIEQGKGNPTLLTLQKLAKSLGRTVASLLI